MSLKIKPDELFDIAMDITTIIVAGHKALRTGKDGKSDQSNYRRAQRFCYGVVDKNIRDIHGCLYDNGKTLLYSSNVAANLKVAKEYRVEHSLPVVELAAKWYESEKLEPQTVIEQGIFNPIVKLTVAEDKALYKIKVDSHRKSPFDWSAKSKQRNSRPSLAHTNPDYEYPFRRNIEAKHRLFLLDSGAANDGSEATYLALTEAANLSYEGNRSFLDVLDQGLQV